VDDTIEFDITFPEDYGEPSLAGQVAHFSVTVKELREKLLPEVDEDFLASLGAFTSLDELRADIRTRLEANALDRARHGFSDRIIQYAVDNASVELPDVLIDQEVEVMHDEFRGTLARQGITEEAYLKAVEKTGDDMHAEFRPDAERRVKTLLVLSKVAEVEGTDVPEIDVEAEVAQGRARYADDPKLLEYFDSERGRQFIRSTLRRSRVVESLIDRWLAAHPEHPALPHLEDAPPSAVADEQAQANASIGATDPGAIMDDRPIAVAADEAGATEEATADEAAADEVPADEPTPA
jgi:trigger factor